MNSKELTELIHQNTRIILPEFGAFLVKDSGEKGFNPSNVSFSPFLRYNDGMLEVYVAKNRGISKEEASKDVREFVEALKNELLEKGYFEIEGLGELKRDQRGSLSFTLFQDEKRYQSDKRVVESPISKKIVTIEPIQTPDKEDFWREEDKPLDDYDLKESKVRKITGAKATVEKLTVTKKTTKTTKKVGDSQQIPVEESIIEPVIELIQEQTQAITPIIQAIPDAEPEPVIAEKVEEKTFGVDAKNDPKVEYERPTPPVNEITEKKGFARLIYTGIALALVILMVIGIRNYYFPPIVDPIKSDTGTPEKISSDQIESNNKIEKPKDEIDKAYNDLTDDKETKERLKKEDEQEEAIKNTLIKNTLINNALVKNAENKTNAGIKFHIIAGSFKNPDFAKKFLNELNTSGYKASIVIQPSGMNAVTIGSYSTREEANEAMRSYKSKLPNLWILKK